MNADILEIRDNGGRRSGIDRRNYSYSGHIPERRSEINRRKQEDRRSGQERRKKARLLDSDSEKNIDRRKLWGQLVAC